jgi:hypothetical protein
MSRSPEVPSEATIIRTYTDLDAEVAAFFHEHYELLILIGKPGLGKTQAMLKYLAETPGIGHLITGKATPLACYKECYDFIHRLLIFNDVEVLWNSDNGKTLMRALTEHQHEKTLQWLSSSKQLDHYPTSFKTTSRAAFVMNRFVSSGDPFYAAIMDRGQLLYFDPTPAEIHRYVAEWFHDQEVFDFIAQHLHHVVGLSARAYNLTAQKKAARRDWKRFFKDRYLNTTSKLWLVQKLVNDPKFKTTEDRVNEFIALEGGCKKTYYNYKAELEKSGQLRLGPVPVIDCKGTAPPKLDRKSLIAEVELAKSGTSSGDDDDDQDSTPRTVKKKPEEKKATKSARKVSAKSPVAKTPKQLAKPAMPDDDLEQEPIDIEKNVIKKAVGNAKAKAKKPFRKKATNKQPPATNRKKRRNDSRPDAENAAANVSHLLTLYTPAKCKV